MRGRRKTLTPEEAYEQAAELCNRAETCASEIATKLFRKGLTTDQINTVIRELREERLIDDYRYARAFANDKVRFSSWGRAKIRLALMQKRIASGAIATALDMIDPDEYAQALRRTVVAKAKDADTSDYAQRMKLLRSVASRGFETDAINREIDRIRCSRQDS